MANPLFTRKSDDRETRKTEEKGPHRMVSQYNLRTHAIHHGYASRKARSESWINLLGGPQACFIHLGCEKDTFHDMEVCQHDLDRLFTSLTYSCESKRKRHKKSVHRILCCTLTAYKEMKYFQGLHDIAYVCMRSCGLKKGLAVFQALCRFWIHPFLSASLSPVEDVCRLIYSIIHQIQPETADILQTTGHERGYFALSWIMTLFMHDFAHDIRMASRILDFLLATHPLLLPAYIAASLVLDHSVEIKRIFRSGGDHATMHVFLSKLPHLYAKRGSSVFSKILRYLPFQDGPRQQQVFGDVFVPVCRIFDLYRQCSPTKLLQLDPNIFTCVYCPTDESENNLTSAAVTPSSVMLHPRVRFVSFYAEQMHASNEEQSKKVLLWALWITCGAILAIWYTFIFFRSYCPFTMMQTLKGY